MGIDARMFVKVPRPVSSDDLRVASHQLFALFGHEKFYTSNERKLPLGIETVWEQDGPDLKPKAGETFVAAHIWTRYYGEHYARGDFRFLHDLAEALEVLFPGGTVMYGGDSSGVCAEPFGAEQRAALRWYWLNNARKPYSRHKNPFMSADTYEDAPTCTRCEIEMSRYGFGGGARGSATHYAAYSCECGEQVVRRGTDEVRTNADERRRRLNELRREAFELLEKERPEAAKELTALDGW